MIITETSEALAETKLRFKKNTLSSAQIVDMGLGGSVLLSPVQFYLVWHGSVQFSWNGVGCV